MWWDEARRIPFFEWKDREKAILCQGQIGQKIRMKEAKRTHILNIEYLLFDIINSALKSFVSQRLFCCSIIHDVY